MTALTFFQEIYQGCSNGFLTVWTKQDKKTKWYPVSELAAAADYSLERNADTDVYFGIGLRKSKLDEFHRGDNCDVLVLPCLWMDIDIVGDGHAQSMLPATFEEALELAGIVGLKPSITVHSGGGVHCYWLFDNPVMIATTAHLQNIIDVSKGFQEAIIRNALDKGYKLDNTSDLARVLRVPGTVNYKNNIVSKVIHNNAARYAPSDFLRYKPIGQYKVAQANSDNGDRRDMSGIVTGSGRRVIDKCVFVQYCRDNAAELPEPYWYALISNIALAKDGGELCHELSKPYRKYNHSETERKIKRAISEHKPHTCEFIKKSLCFEGCSHDCEVKAPIVLTIITKAEQIREFLEREIDDYDAVFDDEYIEALTYAKDKMPAEYARFKNKIKGKANIRDIENCIKVFKKKNSTEEHAVEPLELEGIDLTGIIAPIGWDISIESGVKRLVAQGNSFRMVIASPVAVVISKRLRNIDSGGEKLEVSFYRDGHWHSFVGHRSDILSRNGIMKFGDTGLPVSTGSAPDLVQYLAEFEGANMNSIKCVKSISRVGWISDSEFYPFTQKDQGIEFEPDSSEATVIYKALTKTGDYKSWLSEIGKIREDNAFARFMLAAGFASPLLEKVRHRVFFIHFWHDSKSGKTALLKAALSIWGDPLKLISSFNATQVGLERKAEALDTLPFAIDELQSAVEKRVPASAIVYNIGNGYGKLRGAKVGGIQQLAEWRTIVITTGEQPITSDSSMDGIQSRVLEIYAKLIPDERDGTKLHQLTERNYGLAGSVYMRYIANEVKDNIERNYSQISSALERNFGVSGHLPCVAVVCLGDYYASIALWDENIDTAFDKAISMGVDVLRANQELLQEETTLRAWNFACDWIASNAGRFSNDSVPQYGASDDNGFWVIPQHLHKALEENGFNVTKSIRGFRDRELIPTFTDNKGKKSANKVIRMGNNTVRAYRFNLQPAEGVTKPLKGKK